MLKLFALCDLSCLPTFPLSLIGMAWTGSEPELVGTDAESASAWEVVTDKEKPSVKEEEVIDKLADDLSQVVKIDNEPDFSPDGPSQDQPPNNSSEPKEPDVSTTTAEDQPTAADDPPATDPPATDPPTAPDTSVPKKPTVGLSSLKALEPLTATEGEGPKPTLVAASLLARLQLL